MKKTLSKLLVLAMVVSMTACGKSDKAKDNSTTVTPTQAPSSESAQNYTPGTYTGTAAGNNGDVTVDVTVTADKITTVTVTEQKETKGIADSALTEIPNRIVESQSLSIDTVSGATVTSKAIIAAVADAIAKAGGDASKLEGNDDASKEAKTVQLSADVVVVGGGASGMSAAIRLRELGKTVILLEKNSFLGGTISVSGGNQVIYGSKLQAEAGVTDDSAESLIEDFKKNGANLNDPELLNLFANNVGPTTDWLHEYCGVEFDMKAGLHVLGEYSHNRELAYVGGGAGFAETFRNKVTESNVEVYLNTRATQLTVADGKVTGVLADGQDNVKYEITAGNVLLATGGYGNNKDLLTPEMQSALYYGMASSTGDGIIMATADGIDADTQLMEYGKRYPNGIEVSEGIAKSTIAGNITGWAMSAILVNPEGQRVVNEKASNRTILETELKQTNGMLYLLLDAQTFDVWKTKLGAAGISEEDINKYLAQPAGTTPEFYTAETLEELAKLCGMKEDALTQTVATYNSYVAAGEDKEFGRPADFMKMEIGQGPYYLVEQKPRFATTMGGLVVNDDFNVMNKSGNVIEGLYAAGETVGGVMGDDSPSGANNAWALTSGKLAADAIAK